MTKLNALIVAFAGALLSVACYSGQGNIDLEIQTAQVDGGTDSPDASTTTVEPTKPAEVTKTYGLTDSVVVGENCPDDLIEAKAVGIKQAMKIVIDNVGDIMPSVRPVAFHLSGDATCGTAEAMVEEYGYLSGFAMHGGEQRDVCLFDLEKTSRIIPFTPENAVTLRDQLLPVHEVVHLWFVGRSSVGYGLEEPFAKALSFLISGAMGDFCLDWHPDTYPDATLPDLCRLGLNADNLTFVFQAIAQDAAAKGRPLDVPEAASAISQVVGTDVTPAFVKAGLL